jgi:hypothetical protein
MLYKRGIIREHEGNLDKFCQNGLNKLGNITAESSGRLEMRISCTSLYTIPRGVVMVAELIHTQSFSFLDLWVTASPTRGRMLARVRKYRIHVYPVDYRRPPP